MPRIFKLLLVCLVANFGLAQGVWAKPSTLPSRPTLPALATAKAVSLSSPTCSIGSLSGQFDVDPMGQANYSIPIAVPPGTAGMEPSLTLRYNSASPNGHFGVGWDISGISAIARCNATPLQDRYIGKVNFDNDDRFCLDGLPLVMVSGNYYGEPNSLYKTTPDSQTLVKLYHSNDPARGVLFFRAYTKDGRIIEYGGNEIDHTGANGRIAVVPIGNNGPSPYLARVWAISRVLDRTGNYMDYGYGYDNTLGEFYLFDVQYSGRCTIANSTSSLPGGCVGLPLVYPYNRVKFTWGGRTDKEKWYAGGGRIDLVARILAIDTFTDSAQVGQYRLAYEMSTSSQRSRLKSVTLCEGPLATDVCLAPTTITWSDPVGSSLVSNYVQQLGSGFGGRTTIHQRRYDSQPNPNAWPDLAQGLIMAAITGGLPTSPISWAAGVAAGQALMPSFNTYRTNTSRTFSIQAGLFVKRSWAFTRIKMLQAQLGDFDGDGTSDIVQLAPDGNAYVSLSNGSTYGSSGVNWGVSGNNSPERFKIADVNCDGKSDIIMFLAGPQYTSAYVQLSLGDRFAPIQNWADHVGEPEEMLLADVNGDCKMDLVRVPGPNGANGGQMSVWTSDGTQFVSRGDWGGNYTHAPLGSDTVQFGDFDGDGADDVIEIRSDSPNNADHILRVWRSNDVNGSTGPGNFVLTQDIPSQHDSNTIIQIGDFNGDKLADIALIEPVNGDANIRFWVSTGREFIRAASLDLTATGAITYSSNQPRELNARLGDFNGDGRTDILVFKSIGTNGTTLYLSRSTTFQAVPNWGQLFTNISELAIAEIDGDGRSDVLSFPEINSANAVFGWRSNRSAFPDKVVGITTGFGANQVISYAPLSNNSVYLGNTPIVNGEDGTTDMRGPWYVVQKVSTQSGSHFSHEQLFTYKGSKFNRSRGYLGFDTIIREEPLRKHRDETNYLQVFPFIGIPHHQSLLVDNGQSYVTVRNNVLAWEATPSSATIPPKVRPVKAEQRSAELDGGSKDYTSLEWGFDDYNNPISTKIKLGGGYERTTTRSFVNNKDSWLVGLPYSEDRQSKVSPSAISKTQSLQTRHDQYTGKLLKSTLRWYAPNGEQTLNNQYERDPSGNIRLIQTNGTLLIPRQRFFQYDSRGQFLETSKNALGQTTLYQFGKKFGETLKVTDPSGQAVSWDYDNFGRPLQSNFPDSQTSIEYCFNSPAAETPNDPFYHHAVQITATGSPKRRVYFDRLGRDMRTAVEGFNGTPIINDSVYDSSYRLISSYGPSYLGAAVVPSVSVSYDNLDRPSIIYHENGNQTKYVYTSPATPTANALFSADGYGTNVSIDVEGARRTIRRLDGRGNVVQVEELDDNLGQTLATQSYRYDAVDALERTADMHGNITSRITDNLGFVVETSDPDAGVTAAINDAQGRLINKIDALQRPTTYAYDAADRLVRRDDVDGTSQWHYDLQVPGALSRTDSSDGFLEEYTYDSLARLHSISTQIENDTYYTYFDYDSSGRIKSINHPGRLNTFIGYQYNNFGYLQRVTNLNTNAQLMNVNSLTARNQPRTLRFGNGVRTTHTYDPITGLVTGLTSMRRFTRIQDWGYSYDTINRLASRDDRMRTITDFYGYDALNRLTVAGYCNNMVCFLPAQYAYDEIGNITGRSPSQSSDWATYQYTGTPHAVTGVVNSQVGIAYNYDAVGNMTQGAGVQFSWTARNMPYEISANNQTLRFNYSPGDVKYLQTLTNSQGATTTTQYLGKFFERTTDSTGSRDRNYVYAGPVPLAVIEGTSPSDAQISYIHPDSSDSFDTITSSSGAVSGRNVFDPWGASSFDGHQNTGAPGARGFTGHEQLGAFNLIDAGGRIYDPVLSRFLTPDSIIPVLGDTQSFNTYSYVNNNPANFIDPSGHQSYNPGNFHPGLPTGSGGGGVKFPVPGINTQSFQKGLLEAAAWMAVKDSVETRRAKAPTYYYSMSGPTTPSGRTGKSTTLKFTDDPVVQEYDQLMALKKRIDESVQAENDAAENRATREKFSAVINVGATVFWVFAPELKILQYLAETLSLAGNLDTLEKVASGRKTLTVGDLLTLMRFPAGVKGAFETYSQIGGVGATTNELFQKVVLGVGEQSVSTGLDKINTGIYVFGAEGNVVSYTALPEPQPDPSVYSSPFDKTRQYPSTLNVKKPLTVDVKH